MKLILASCGFTTAEIVQKCVELVGKPKDEINFAVINEAYAVEHEKGHSWVLRDLCRITENFKGRFELVNLLALDSVAVKKRINVADVIFVEGGNTEYLMNVFKKTGFDTILREFLKEKVYVGSSAGAVVMGKRTTTKAYTSAYQKGEETYGTEDFLRIVNFTIRPHHEGYRPKDTREAFIDAVKGSEGVIYAIRDDTAIVIDGDKQYSIGSTPVKVQDGVVVAFA